MTAPEAPSPQASGRGSEPLPAGAPPPEWNVGARTGLGLHLEREPGRRSPTAQSVGAASSHLPLQRAAAAGRGEARRGEREAGRGGGRGTRDCGEVGGGEQEAAGPGKKRTWLRRRAAPSAARGEGAPGVSDRDGELEPRAAAAAGGPEAAARIPSGRPRPADGGRRGCGRRPRGSGRPPRAEGPGDRDGAYPASGRAGPPGRSLSLSFSSALVVLAAGMEP